MRVNNAKKLVSPKSTPDIATATSAQSTAMQIKTTAKTGMTEPRISSPSMPANCAEITANSGCISASGRAIIGDGSHILRHPAFQPSGDAAHDR